MTAYFPSWIIRFAALHRRLFEWMSRLKLRTTISDAGVELRTNAHKNHGIHFGVW